MHRYCTSIYCAVLCLAVQKIRTVRGMFCWDFCAVPSFFASAEHADIVPTWSLRWRYLLAITLGEGELVVQPLAAAEGSHEVIISYAGRTGGPIPAPIWRFHSTRPNQ